jgi:hypothetical protein
MKRYIISSELASLERHLHLTLVPKFVIVVIIDFLPAPGSSYSPSRITLRWDRW